MRAFDILVLVEHDVALFPAASRGGRARVPSPTGLVHVLYGLNLLYGEGPVRPTTSSSARTTPSTGLGVSNADASPPPPDGAHAQYLRELNKCA